MPRRVALRRSGTMQANPDAVCPPDEGSGLGCALVQRPATCPHAGGAVALLRQEKTYAQGAAVTESLPLTSRHSKIRCFLAFSPAFCRFSGLFARRTRPHLNSLTNQKPGEIKAVHCNSVCVIFDAVLTSPASVALQRTAVWSIEDTSSAPPTSASEQRCVQLASCRSRKPAAPGKRGGHSSNAQAAGAELFYVQ